MPTYDHGVAGLTGTIGVTVRNADGTSHDARTTTGITEPVAGSGVYHIAHPHPGTLLLFIFDGGVGTVGASVWDDGLTPQAAAQAAIVAQPVTLAADAIDAASLKADAVTEIQNGLATAAALATVDGKADTLTSRLTATRAGYLDALNTGVPVVSASVTAIAEAVRDLATSGLAALKTLIDAIKAKTDNLPSDPAGQSEIATLIDALPTAAENADAVWDEAVSDHVTAGTAGRFLQRVYRYFFNKRTHTNSAVTVYADDGTTADATMVVSGDTTTVTKAAPS